MNAHQYRKKPVVIEAMQYTGTNGGAILAWAAGHKVDTVYFNRTADLIICTLEGDMITRPGDWIIRGVKGEFYPCRDDIFKATYETV